MKTIAELEQDILDITMKIDREFPELTKYNKEIPINESNNDNEVINIKDLNDYYMSLVDMLEEYSKTHVSKKLEE